MARKSRHSIQKRQREQRKREKNESKRLKKVARKEGEIYALGPDGEILQGPDGPILASSLEPAEDTAEPSAEPSENEPDDRVDDLTVQAVPTGRIAERVAPSDRLEH